MDINTQTQLCAVIGDPVAHSLSPAIHNAAFQATGLNYVYLAFGVNEVAHFLTGMRAMPNFRGLSVTIPHKVAVMEHLDVIDPAAERVGCVNTIVHEDGRLTGYITDGLGVVRAFDNAQVDLHGKRVLFLGAGGAVRAVAFAFAETQAPAKITLLGRNPERVAPLIEDLRDACNLSVFQGALHTELEDALAEHDIIIQGTPIGMYGHQEGESIVPAGALRPDQVIFDMVYRPLKTRLIEDAEAAGCQVILGLEMLLNQAELQFERWTGVPAPSQVMRDALLAALSA